MNSAITTTGKQNECVFPMSWHKILSRAGGDYIKNYVYFQNVGNQPELALLFCSPYIWVHWGLGGHTSPYITWHIIMGWGFHHTQMYCSWYKLTHLMNFFGATLSIMSYWENSHFWYSWLHKQFISASSCESAGILTLLGCCRWFLCGDGHISDESKSTIEYKQMR